MKRLLIPIFAICGLFAVASPSGAAVTIGQPSCAVDTGGAPPTLFQGTSSVDVTYVIPADGVITRWGVNRTGVGADSISAALLATRAGNTFTVVTATPYEATPGSVATQFSARMPAQAGQYLGISGYNSTPTMCSTGSGDDGVEYYGDYMYTGDVFTGNPIPQAQAMVWATLEADLDRDGYGDETQDKCPQSAAFIDACPVLSISQQLSYKKNTISVLATASIDSALTATATVKLPKTKKSKAKTVTIKSAATSFTAGQLKTIKLKLPSSVKNALKAKQKLTATVSLTGNGLANTATASAKVKLR